MPPSPKTLQTLYALSGNECAFPGCDAALVEPATDDDEPALLANAAHIVAASRQGPRGREALSEAARDLSDNLLLLCPSHHKLVDNQPRTYSVQVLREMKRGHERGTKPASHSRSPRPEISETVQSSLLPVTAAPAQVFSAVTEHPSVARIAALLDRSRAQGQRVDFLVRDDRVYSFWDLMRDGPFRGAVQRATTEICPARNLWADPVRRLWYVELLNKGLTSDLASRGLRFDRIHHRHYFLPTTAGERRTEEYSSKTGRKLSRDVVYEEHRRDGTGKGVWWHIAAQFRFEQTSESQWCLAVRPGWQLTKDGSAPLEGRRVGRRVTRRKATTYNEMLLNELQFWRSFLTRQQPRLILRVGAQSLIVDANYLAAEVTWPGVPDDMLKVNTLHEENLFTLADLEDALGYAPSDDELFEEPA